MRILVTLLTLFVFLIVSTFLVAFAPYHFYHTTITEGISTGFLHLPKTSKEFLQALPYHSPLNINNVGEDERFWRTFHFTELEIPLPIRHPSLNFYPLITQTQGDTFLGLSYRDVKNKELFAFKTMRKRDFDIDMTGQALFELPFYKVMILKNSNDYLWEDTFARRLSLPDRGNRGFWEYLSYLWPIGYNTLVYDLFVLHVRNDFLKKYYDDQGYVINKIEYFKERNLGIVELKNKNEADDDFYLYHLYELNNDRVVNLELKVRKHDGRATWIKDHFIKHFVYKRSTEDSSAPLYAEYKSLPYKAKIDQEGLSTLFAAWSHRPDNCGFMQEIINFLERGTHKDVSFINPLYNHAFRLCGSNYSSNPDLLRETAKEQHARRLKEEKAKEHEEAAKRDISQIPDEFEGVDAKIDFLLKRAKENTESGSIFDSSKSIRGH